MNEEEQLNSEKTSQETRKPAWKNRTILSCGFVVFSWILILSLKFSDRTEVKEEFRQVNSVSPTKVYRALKELGVLKGKRYLAEVVQEYPQSYYYDNQNRFAQVRNNGLSKENKQQVGSLIHLTNAGSLQSAQEIGLWYVEKRVEIEQVSFAEGGLLIHYNLLEDDGTSSSEPGDVLIPWKSENRPSSGYLTASNGIVVPYRVFTDKSKEYFTALAQECPQYYFYDQDCRFVQICNRRSPAKNEQKYESVLVLWNVGSPESVKMGLWITERNLRVEGVSFSEDEMRVNCTLLSDEGTSSSQKREYRIPWKKGTDPGCGILCRSGEVVSESSDGNDTNPESVPADSI